MSRIEFSIYEVATGKITAAMTAYSEEDRDANIPPGHAWVEGFHDPASFYVADGAVAAFPEKPFDHATFDFDAGEWIDARPIEQVKIAARIKLSRWVEAQRRLYITKLPGQEMIYLAKEEEAFRFLSDPEPDMSAYPFISSEVGITAQTAWQVAQLWAHMASIWRGAAAILEQARLGTAAQIEAAATTQEVEEIMSAIQD